MIEQNLSRTQVDAAVNALTMAYKFPWVSVPGVGFMRVKRKATKSKSKKGKKGKVTNKEVKEFNSPHYHMYELGKSGQAVLDALELVAENECEPESKTSEPIII